MPRSSSKVPTVGAVPDGRMLISASSAVWIGVDSGIPNAVSTPVSRSPTVVFTVVVEPRPRSSRRLVKTVDPIVELVLRPNEDSRLSSTVVVREPDGSAPSAVSTVSSVLPVRGAVRSAPSAVSTVSSVLPVSGADGSRFSEVNRLVSVVDEMVEAGSRPSVPSRLSSALVEIVDVGSRPSAPSRLSTFTESPVFRPNAPSRLSGDNSWVGSMPNALKTLLSDRLFRSTLVSSPSPCKMFVKPRVIPSPEPRALRPSRFNKPLSVVTGLVASARSVPSPLSLSPRSLNNEPNVRSPSPSWLNKLLRSRLVRGVLPKPSAFSRSGRLISMFADVAGARTPL